jgi:oxygen-independent coproporphyrinogen-3 oxidase
MCNLELPASLSQGLEREYARLGQCSKHGLVEVTPENIRITPRGRYFLHSLCSHHDISVAWSSNQWGVPQVV